MNNKYLFPASIVVSAFMIAVALIYSAGVSGIKQEQGNAKTSAAPNSNSANDLLPESGIDLGVSWGNLGAKLIEAGVIDRQKFEALYAARGGLTSKEKTLLYADSNGNLKITPENAPMLLNLLWALGLGNKNEILEKGPMADPQYGGIMNFASTAGWTLATGSAANHYSRHRFISLTPEEQALVERVAQNIYRPCCGNSTYFPDCNHGMAMLGLLELMASQGVSESDMYKYALKINELWFPDTYSAINQYLRQRGSSLDAVDSKIILGPDYSSAEGYQNILLKITPIQRGNDSSCGVDTGQIQPQRQPSGCGT